MSKNGKVSLRGIILDTKPYAYKREDDGKWTGIAYDILKLLERVSDVKEQGRIHGYQSPMRVGRGSDN